MSRPLEARVMSVVGSRGTRDRCPCHVRGRLPRDRRPSTVGRVVLNAPHEMPPPHHRPSWDSWIRPSLTDAPPIARPSEVRRQARGKSAAAHLGMSQNVGNRRMPAHQKSVACPSPVRTKPVCVRERRRSEGRTRGKRRRDAALIRPRRERKARPPRTSSELRPCKGRVPSRICPSLARRKPVVCPPCVHSANDQRQMHEPTNDRTPPRTLRPSLPARQAPVPSPSQVRCLPVSCP